MSDIVRNIIANDGFDLTVEDVTASEDARIREEELRTRSVISDTASGSQDTARPGVVDGVVVGACLVPSAFAANTLRISPGYAFDYNGSVIYLSANKDLTIPGGALTDYYICATSVTAESDSRSHPITGVMQETRDNYVDEAVDASITDIQIGPGGTGIYSKAFYLLDELPTSPDIVLGRIVSTTPNFTLYGRDSSTEAYREEWLRYAHREVRDPKKKFYDMYPSNTILGGLVDNPSICSATYYILSAPVHASGERDTITLDTTGSHPDLGAVNISGCTLEVSCVVGLASTAYRKIRREVYSNTSTTLILKTNDGVVLDDTPYPEWIVTPSAPTTATYDTFTVTPALLSSVEPGCDLDNILACQGTHIAGRTVTNPLGLHAKDIGAMSEYSIQGQFYTDNSTFTSQPFMLCTGKVTVATAPTVIYVGATVTQGIGVSYNSGVTWGMVGDDVADDGLVDICFPEYGTYVAYACSYATGQVLKQSSTLEWSVCGCSPIGPMELYTIKKKPGSEIGYVGGVSGLYGTVNDFEDVNLIEAANCPKPTYCLSIPQYGAGSYGWAVGGLYSGWKIMRGTNMGEGDESWEGITGPAFPFKRCAFGGSGTMGFFLTWEVDTCCLFRTLDGGDVTPTILSAGPASTAILYDIAVSPTEDHVVACGANGTVWTGARMQDTAIDWKDKSIPLWSGVELNGVRLLGSTPNPSEVWVVGWVVSSGKMVLAHTENAFVSTPYWTKYEDVGFDANPAVNEHLVVEAPTLGGGGSGEAVVTGLPYTSVASYYPIAVTATNKSGGVYRVSSVSPITESTFRITLNSSPTQEIVVYWSTMGY